MVGTQFEVSREPGGVRVAVFEGAVKVRQNGAPEVLLESEQSRLFASDAGQLAEAAAPTPVEAAPAAAPEPAPFEVEAEPEPAPSAPGPKAGPRPPTRSVGPRITAKQADEAEQIFSEGRRALLRGRYREAADAFEALQRRFPNNARAPLAALELGRLRLDQLKEPGKAAEALEVARRLIPSGALREDAEARLVQALEESKQTGRCRDARKRYLEAYPDGPHRPNVLARCQGK